MAYCEFADRECEFLDAVQEFEGQALVERATGDRFDSRVLGWLEETTARYKNSREKSSYNCSPESCGIVKYALHRVLILDVAYEHRTTKQH